MNCKYNLFYVVGEFIHASNWIGQNLLLYSYNFFAVYSACREANKIMVLMKYEINMQIIEI